MSAPPRFRTCLFLLLALLAAGAQARNESGLPTLQNFAPRDYRAHNQTWAAVQDTDGVMYFGNRGSVLRYDGAQWLTLDVPNTTFVRGLALAADRTLYAGAYNQLGYFPPPTAPGARRTFISLLEKLPAADREFGSIWNVVILGDGTVGFLTTQKLLLWRDGRFTSLPVTVKAQIGGDTVFLPSPGGLEIYRDGRFTTISTDPFFGAVRIDFFLPEADGSVLLGTADRGLFRLADGRVAPVATALDPFFHKEGLRAGHRLADGTLALSTRNSAVVLLDRDYRLLCRLDKTNGLSNATVRAFTPDREGGLWLSHNNGATRLDWPSALTVFDRRNGLDADLAGEITRHAGVLYVSTGSKLFYLGDDGAAAPNAVFHPVRDAATGQPLNSNLRALLSTPHGLFASGSSGVMLVSGNTARVVFDPGEPILVLADSPRDPDRLYVGLQTGLIRLRWRDATWHLDGRVPGLDGEIRSIVEAADGTLWASGSARGFYRITGSADLAQARVENITGGRGLPDSVADGFVYVLRWRNRPLFCADTLYTYDDASDRFATTTELGPKLDEFSIATQGTDSPDHLWLRTFAKAPEAGQWHDRRIWQAGTDGRWQALPYLAADLVDDSRIFREETHDHRHVLWIPGTDTLLRVDLAASPFATHALPAPLLASDQLVPGAELPARRDAAVFRHVTPSFRPQARLEYETQLVGLDAHPRPWSAAYETTFTGLSAGDYSFRVRARDSDGVLSPFSEITFTILPPWWQQPWAWVLYALVAAALVHGLVRWRVAALSARNRRLEEIVTARTATLEASEAGLRVARDAAEAASRAKSAFLANMSHELRTPLNAVLGYARMLHQDPALSALNRQRAGVIDESGSHLLQVINDVLDLSKIEAGKLTLQPAPFALRHLLDGVATTFRALAFEKGLEFHAVFAADLPESIISDEHRLRQVLFNLLGNAIKFTPAGRVTFAVHRVPATGTDATVRFAVSDTGVGIAAAQLRYIFLPFHQAHGSALSQQGTGLGLAISQHIVELLGGEFVVTSELGRGSSFHFDLTLPTGADLPAPESRRVTGYKGVRRRLLVVDDEATNRDVLRGFLQPLGFEIHEAANGQACLQELAALLPDALLLDLRMPDLDGFATVQQIRTNPAWRTLPVIAVSASVFEENRQDAINAGFDDFLPKPIQLERLLATLQKYLRLEWVHATGTSFPPFTAVPGPAVIDELHQLALSGEVDQLRARLAEIAAAEPDYHAFTQALDTLALRFQMKRIRDLLSAQKKRPS